GQERASYGHEDLRGAHPDEAGGDGERRIDHAVGRDGVCRRHTFDAPVDADYEGADHRRAYHQPPLEEPVRPALRLIEPSGRGGYRLPEARDAQDLEDGNHRSPFGSVEREDERFGDDE